MTSPLSRAALAAVLILILSSASAQATLTDLSYDLAALSEEELCNDWTSWGVGGRLGTLFTSQRVYSRTDIPLGSGEAFLFEGVVSSTSPGLPNAGAPGTELRVFFYDAQAPDIPPFYPHLRDISVRLLTDWTSNEYIGLVDNSDGTLKAQLPVDWSQAYPGNEIRLRRQLVGTDSIIFLEAGREGGPLLSTQVLLSEFGVTTGTLNELAFGNFLAGGYGSTWYSVRVIVSSDPDTLLPPQVPLPAALPLFASGLGALGLLGWYRNRKAAAS